MKTLLALVFTCAPMFAQRITPIVLVAGTQTITTDSVFLDVGTWISAGAMPVVLIVKDGNGIPLGNSWTIAANNTIPLGQFAGAYFPGGIYVQCVSGCTSTNANAFFAWKK